MSFITMRAQPQFTQQHSNLFLCSVRTQPPFTIYKAIEQIKVRAHTPTHSTQQWSNLIWRHDLYQLCIKQYTNNLNLAWPPSHSTHQFKYSIWGHGLHSFLKKSGLTITHMRTQTPCSMYTTMNQNKWGHSLQSKFNLRLPTNNEGTASDYHF